MQIMLQKNASQQTKKYVLVEKKIQVILLHTIEIMDQKIQVIKKKTASHLPKKCNLRKTRHIVAFILHKCILTQ